MTKVFCTDYWAISAKFSEELKKLTEMSIMGRENQFVKIEKQTF